MPATRALLLLAATSTLCTQCAANDPAWGGKSKDFPPGWNGLAKTPPSK